MKLVQYAVALVFLLIPTTLVVVWANAAEARLAEVEQAQSQSDVEVARASAADEDYCTPQLKQILRRVLNSCGLLGRNSERGCQPAEARNVATMSGNDFNALFIPMSKRGGIVQFDRDSAVLDQADRGLVEGVFAQRRGASYFLVVSRASPEGSVEHNRDLSRQRAENVLNYLGQTFRDPDLERQVGLLWLGEEYAQLDPSFCSWRRSGTEEQCQPEQLNRSAFVAWIDCRL
jgi:outer membrane protein OmpA-like peptidoglycan-associated protein